MALYRAYKSRIDQSARPLSLKRKHAHASPTPGGSPTPQETRASDPRAENLESDALPTPKKKRRVSEPSGGGPGTGRKGISSGLSTVVRVNGKRVKDPKGTASGSTGGDWWTRLVGTETSKIRQ